MDFGYGGGNDQGGGEWNQRRGGGRGGGRGRGRGGGRGGGYRMFQKKVKHPPQQPNPDLTEEQVDARRDKRRQSKARQQANKEKPPPELTGKALHLWHNERRLAKKALKAKKNSGRERPPPGLKGREIGLWYASRQGKRNREQEVQNRTYIQMDKDKEKNISKLLNTIRAGENVQSQPQRSYKDHFDDSSTSGDEDEMEDSTNTCEDKFKDKKYTDRFSDRNVDSYHAFNSSQYSDNSKKDCDRKYKSHGGAAASSLKERIGQHRKHSGVADCWEDEAAEEDDMEDDAVAGSSAFNRRNDKEPPKQELKSGQSDREKRVGKPDCDAEHPSSSVVIDSDESDEDDNDEEDGDALLACKESEQDDIMYQSELNDQEKADIESEITELYRDEEETDNEFLAEFYENKEANRKSSGGMDAKPNQKAQMKRSPDLDRHMLEELNHNHKSNQDYKRMLEFRKRLPSYKMRQSLLRVINSNQVTVISGETGCGKTTQVTQFILDDYIERGEGSLCRVVCTQPRRISAISVAERVAEERGEACGSSSVGYQIRLEAKLPRKQGSILYCTTGIMLRWLVSDPWLSCTSHVILDEIHERDLQSDFLMIIMRDLIDVRPDIKLILMSATLNAEMFSQYFGNCPMLNIPGFTFPVQEFYMEDIVEMTRYLHHVDHTDLPRARNERMRGRNREKLQEEQREKDEYYKSLNLAGQYSRATVRVLRALDYSKIDIELAAYLIDYITRAKPPGAILVFMPGWEDIRKLNNHLTQIYHYGTDRFRIIPLHSRLPTVNQRQVFDRPPQGVRKIVIATNIAETSITIDDIVYVVDCGKIKMKNFNPENNITTLAAEWVSRANAKQRRGRSGRVQPGECYHMYTQLHEEKLEDYQLPEMLRTQLEELCLQIKLLKLGHVEPFVQKAMQPPLMSSLHAAVTNLQNLNALDGNEELTALGYHLAKMPVDPHMGKMLLFAAMFCCLDPILTIAASLSYKDAFFIPMGQEAVADQRRLKLADGNKSDHIMLANAYKGWERARSRGTHWQYCRENFLSGNILELLKNMRKQFAQMLYDMKFIRSMDPKDGSANINSNNMKLLNAMICAGLYPNVAHLKHKPNPGRSGRPPLLTTPTDKRVCFHPKSINSKLKEFESPWFIYHLKMKTVGTNLYDCSMVSPYPLLFFGGTVNVRKDCGEDCIVVDDWIIFKSSRRVANLVKELREELDKLLEYKIKHPGVTSWDSRQKEGALMRAISDLITSEEHKSRPVEVNKRPSGKVKIDPHTGGAIWAPN